MHADGSPLGRAAGAASPAAARAFGLLADETRLSIMLALWEAFEPFGDDAALGFTELRDRVGVRQGGQFNYHLDRLVGHFVRKTDAGYALTRAGHQLVRTVIAGAAGERPTLERTPVGLDCDFCGASAAVTYEDDRLFLVCTDCEGFFEAGEDLPTGYLSSVELDPAGLVDRDPDELLYAGLTGAYHDLFQAVEGVCNACSGPMDGWLEVCEDHDEGGVCEACGRRFAAIGRFACVVCKNHHTAPPRTAVIGHPAVVAFYYDHGFPIQYAVTDAAAMDRKARLVKGHAQRVTSVDPPLVEVVVNQRGERLTLTVDDDLQVVDVERSTSGT